MIVDVHTHFWDASEDLLPVVAEDLQRVGGSPQSLVVTPESYAAGMKGADVSIVFGLGARHTGFVVSNNRVADFAAKEATRRIAFASADPLHDPDPVGEIQRCVEELGMRGVKLGPTYQGVPPTHPNLLKIYEYSQAHGLPILFHQGTTYSRLAPLKFASPVLLEEVAFRYPELTMIVAHLGHPWCAETIALIRKQPNIFADISALYYRPYQLYQALKLAEEYGADGKILFGTDFPVATVEQTLQGLRDLEAYIERYGLPPLRCDLLNGIIHRDSLSLLKLQISGISSNSESPSRNL